MSNFNSVTLREFIKSKKGNKITNGINERDVIVMDKANKTVAQCFVSTKVKNWSLDELLRKPSKVGDVEYHVYLDPQEENKYYIYSLQITAIL